MPRLRKLRRKQKYQYHVNRKRLNNKLTKLPDIKCKVIKDAWDNKKSVKANLAAMGLAGDPNDLQIISKTPMHYDAELEAEMEDETLVELEEVEDAGTATSVPRMLETIAKQKFSAKKAIAHPLPKGMFAKLTRFIDKYGEDYEAMANDHTNYEQETPAQLRQQVNRLKNIPQQWIPYLKSRGLMESGKPS